MVSAKAMYVQGLWVLAYCLHIWYECKLSVSILNENFEIKFNMTPKKVQAQLIAPEQKN